MKQFTTQQQWEELSERGKIKLLEWYKSKEWQRDFGTIEEHRMTTRWIPFLSIGQMIEFLDEEGKKNYGDFTDYLPVRVTSYEEIESTLRKGEDFCDYLYEAVKQVLEL